MIWVSASRLKESLGDDGHLHLAPELVVEVSSPGEASAERDRTSKLACYSRWGVQEYWVVDWRAQMADIYRRGVAGAGLQHAASFHAGDTLTSPLLPGFALPVSEITGLRIRSAR